MLIAKVAVSAFGKIVGLAVTIIVGSGEENVASNLAGKMRAPPLTTGSGDEKVADNAFGKVVAPPEADSFGMLNVAVNAAGVTVTPVPLIAVVKLRVVPHAPKVFEPLGSFARTRQ